MKQRRGLPLFVYAVHQTWGLGKLNSVSTDMGPSSSVFHALYISKGNGNYDGGKHS